MTCYFVCWELVWRGGYSRRSVGLAPSSAAFDGVIRYRGVKERLLTGEESGFSMGHLARDSEPGDFITLSSFTYEKGGVEGEGDCPLCRPNACGLPPLSFRGANYLRKLPNVALNGLTDGWSWVASKSCRVSRRVLVI